MSKIEDEEKIKWKTTNYLYTIRILSPIENELSQEDLQSFWNIVI